MTVLGTDHEMIRPCERCAPIIAGEVVRQEEQARIQQAMNDCGLVMPKVPAQLVGPLSRVLADTDAGKHVVVLSLPEGGKTTIAQAWAVTLAKRGLHVGYLRGEEVTAPHVDDQVVGWTAYEALAIDGVAQDKERLTDWQSSRLARVAGAMKNKPFLMTTGWPNDYRLPSGEWRQGWEDGLGEPLAARLRIRAVQHAMPRRST